MIKGKATREENRRKVRGNYQWGGSNRVRKVAVTNKGEGVAELERERYLLKRNQLQSKKGSDNQQRGRSSIDR